MDLKPLGPGRRAVVWTRGKGCAELADLLGGGESSRVSGDPAEACINYRADLLVARRLSHRVRSGECCRPSRFPA